VDLSTTIGGQEVDPQFAAATNIEIAVSAVLTSGRGELAADKDCPGSRRIFFFANGVYTDHIAGGDIHFFELARAAAGAGYRLAFFGAKALEKWLTNLPQKSELLLTDEAILPGSVEQSFTGQLRLFKHYVTRFVNSMRHLGKVRTSDFAYAVADSWYDGLPVAFSKSTRKVLILHMEAPTLGEIFRRSRADVDRFRVASLHYWLSQQSSLRCLRRCRHKHILYVNPSMRARLLALGFHPSEISYISFGLDVEAADRVLSPSKVYDVAWIGRVHRQKGIDDLLTTLKTLSQTVPEFRAVLIGRGAEALRQTIKERSLEKNVILSGHVSEEEKYHLLKSSRAFLMPSRYEGSPRAIGEAIACGATVIAYDVPTYRPVFADLLKYVPCFDVATFAEVSREEIFKSRAGVSSLDPEKNAEFKRHNSWQAVHSTFLQALRTLEQQAPSVAGGT
jgi:glycosyltransferase involved in cell wall biosynthesis